MAKRDFYEVLGVSRDTDADEMKKAYRSLAMKFHPDRNQGNAAAEHKFKEISEAYDVLKDDQKRAAYDRFGHAAFENGGAGARGQAGGFEFGSGFADIFDAFREMLTAGPSGEYDADELGDLEALASVAAFPTRVKCATLSWHTLKGALDGQGAVSTE